MTMMNEKPDSQLSVVRESVKGIKAVIREPKPKTELVAGVDIPVGRLAVRHGTKLVFYRTLTTLACLTDVGRSFSGSVPSGAKEFRVLPVGTKVTLTQV